jgi:hypothetical protein
MHGAPGGEHNNVTRQYTFFALEWTFIDDRKFYTRLGFKW